MPTTPVTKRQTLAQVLICLGCCCGRVDRGKPAVPVDWLKTQWKQHKLLRSIHLSICCTVRGELIRILGNLMKRKDKFDYIMV